MDTFPLSTAFIVIGLHVTENLQHHQSADVKRILEEKGFAEVSLNAPDEIFRYFAQKDTTPNTKRTLIIFGDKDTVHPTEGVKFYDTPESLNK